MPTKIKCDFIIVANGFGLVSLQINYLDYNSFIGHLACANAAIIIRTIVDDYFHAEKSNPTQVRGFFQRFATVI